MAEFKIEASATLYALGKYEGFHDFCLYVAPSKEHEGLRSKAAGASLLNSQVDHFCMICGIFVCYS